MEITKDKLDKIEKEIVEIVIAALDAGAIKEQELAAVGQHVLDRIDKIETQEELILFLEVMAERWGIFMPLVSRVNGEVEQNKEQITVYQAENLIKQGNIDEALKIMKGTE